MTRATRVAVVGPGPPHRGGIVDHTVELVRRLRSRRLLSEHAVWRAPFPLLLHPDGRDVLDRRDEAARTVVPPTSDLRWWDPSGWIRIGRRLGHDNDLIVIVVTSPRQVPAIAAIARSFRSAAPGRRRVHLIVHNVFPHERARSDVRLMRRLLSTGDAILVHSPGEAALAHGLGAHDVRVMRLPLHAPDGIIGGSHPAGDERHDALGFFGFVRPYKGLEDLIRALALTRSTPRLTVLGRFWEPVERYRALVDASGLSDRVELRDRFASAAELTSLLAAVDAVALPYRTATGTQQPRLAQLRGVPAIVTDVGDLGSQVRDDIDGIVVPASLTDRGPEDRAAALASAIDAFYEGERWRRLRSGVRPPDADAEWDAYLDVLVRVRSAAVPDASQRGADQAGGTTEQSDPDLGRPHAQRDRDTPASRPEDGC